MNELIDIKHITTESAHSVMRIKAPALRWIVVISTIPLKDIGIYEPMKNDGTKSNYFCLSRVVFMAS